MFSLWRDANLANLSSSRDGGMSCCWVVMQMLVGRLLLQAWPVQKAGGHLWANLCHLHVTFGCVHCDYCAWCLLQYLEDTDEQTLFHVIAWHVLVVSSRRKCICICIFTTYIHTYAGHTSHFNRCPGVWHRDFHTIYIYIYIYTHTYIYNHNIHTYLCRS
jgi:hypothetical protein